MKDIDKIRELTNTLSFVESNLKSENKILEFLLEHSLDGYWDWDIRNNYEYLSPKFKQQLGYSDDEMENSPESWMSICNVEDLDRAKSTIGLVLGGKEDEFKEELRFIHKEGYEIKILCRGIIIKRDESGNPLRMVGTHRII